MALLSIYGDSGEVNVLADPSEEPGGLFVLQVRVFTYMLTLCTY